ncbi:MAG: phosphoribosylaminoimidazolesuccinocarboxamide synthase [Candidatus Hadarchaeales archaeon]
MEVEEPLLQSELPLKLYKRGKVRDIYELGENLLVVSTDRISAFDVVLPNGIPHKGEALNRLSVFWFNLFSDVPSHFVEAVDGRSMLVRKASPFPFEFIVRGFLYGSAWESYAAGKSVCGVHLPPGLKKASRLPEPLLTPTTKEESGHDREVRWEEVVERLGRKVAEEIRELSLSLYERAFSLAEKRGVLIADTKFEFGSSRGELLLIDEVLTPDSSRFWPLEGYQEGKDPPSFDKQYVRDYLISVGWDKKPPAPRLPPEVVLQTSKKYVECYERVTGKKF